MDWRPTEEDINNAIARVEARKEKRKRQCVARDLRERRMEEEWERECVEREQAQRRALEALAQEFSAAPLWRKPVVLWRGPTQVSFEIVFNLLVVAAVWFFAVFFTFKLLFPGWGPGR
jgi:hypothetical protein